jgi:hypothetical protein
MRVTETVERIASVRPALLFRDNLFSNPPENWKQLELYRAQIQRAALAVGRLGNRAPGPGPNFSGTAFLVAPDTVMVADFEVPASARPESLIVDFADSPKEESRTRYAVAGFAGTIAEAGVKLLRIRAESQYASTDRVPLTLSSLPDLTPGRVVYVVGYPVADARVQASVIQSVLGTEGGVKRLQPGYLLSLSPDKRYFYHDCFTVSGNAGSPVVDLATGKVLGLHRGGQPVTAAGPGLKQAIPLWTLIGHPLLKQLGARFQ